VHGCEPPDEVVNPEVLRTAGAANPFRISNGVQIVLVAAKSDANLR
jgi:hypothetical protein